MSKPTARELIEQRKIGHSPVVRVRADDALAARVEKVLALKRPPRAGTTSAWRAGWNAAIYEVGRALNGADE